VNEFEAWMVPAMIAWRERITHDCGHLVFIVMGYIVNNHVDPRFRDLVSWLIFFRHGESISLLVVSSPSARRVSGVVGL